MYRTEINTLKKCVKLVINTNSIDLNVKEKVLSSMTNIAQSVCACVRTAISLCVILTRVVVYILIIYSFIYLNGSHIDSAVHPFGLSPRSISDCHILRVKQWISTNDPLRVAVLYFIFNISHIYVTRMCLLNVVALNRCWNNAEMVVESESLTSFIWLVSYLCI